MIRDTGEEVIGIREGEKIHEILINLDEMRYAQKLDDKYVIFNGNQTEEYIKNNYENTVQVDPSKEYSSNLVEKISKDELKELIVKSGLIKD